MTCIRARILLLATLLGGCGTFHSQNGPHADAPRLYSGVRLDWAVLSSNQHYMERYQLQRPLFPWADLPVSFAADTLLIPFAVEHEIYQWLAVPPGGW